MGIAKLAVQASDLPPMPEPPPREQFEESPAQDLEKKNDSHHPIPSEPPPIAEVQKPVHQARPVFNTVKPNGVMSAKDMMAIQYAVLDLGPFRKYFGPVSDNFDMMVHGEPGAGKTHFLLQLANFLANHVGNTLYISSEEFGSKTMQDVVGKSIPEQSQNLYFYNSLDNLNLNDFAAVFLDSVQHVGLDLKRYKELRLKHPNQIFILILQKTKDGNFKGGKDWEHEVDICCEMRLDPDTGDRLFCIDTKNRFGPKGQWVMKTTG